MPAVAAAGWIWIPIVFAAAAAQTVRNAAQRSLTKSAGVFPATFVRFFYGLPFAALALIGLLAGGDPLPETTASFLAWLALGAIAQLIATAFLVGAMEQRSFVVAVVYSKTEVIQIGIYSVVFLGESIPAAAVFAILLSTTGVVMLSGKTVAQRAAGPSAWLSPGAMLGLAAGAGFALSAVGYRGAFVSLAHPDPVMAGFYSVVLAQSLQVVLLGAYLVARDRGGIMKVLIEWRVSSLAGLMGAVASMGWLTAYAMRSAVDVRILGLVEVLFSYVMSRKLFAERVSGMELVGILAVVLGIVLISVAR